MNFGHLAIILSQHKGEGLSPKERSNKQLKFAQVSFIPI